MLLESITILTPALLGLTAVLSGWRKLEILSMKFCSSPVSLGKVTLSIGHTFLTFAILRFTLQCFQVHRAQTKLDTYSKNMAEGTILATPDQEDRLRGNAWRQERNFWIGFFSLFLWLVYIQATQVLSSLRVKADQLRKDRVSTSQPVRSAPRPSSQSTASESHEIGSIPSTEAPSATKEIHMESRATNLPQIKKRK